jgi:hypothetical protein
VESESKLEYTFSDKSHRKFYAKIGRDKEIHLHTNTQKNPAKNITIVNIYAPNISVPKFIK